MTGRPYWEIETMTDHNRRTSIGGFWRVGLHQGRVLMTNSDHYIQSGRCKRYATLGLLKAAIDDTSIDNGIHPEDGTVIGRKERARFPAPSR